MKQDKLKLDQENIRLEQEKIEKEVNHPKEMRRQKILNKIIQINHEEVDFREVEVTMLAEEDLLFVLSVVKKVIEHLNSQIITCKSQSKESSLD